MKTEAEFAERLEQSIPSQRVVGKFLRRRGFLITEHIPRVVPPSERKGYDDGGDLHVVKRAEVKHMITARDFVSVDDYPHDNVIVNEAYKAHRLPIKHLFAYFIVSKDMKNMLVVPPATRDHWFDADLYDRSEGEMRRFTLCPKEHCVHINLEELADED